MKDFDQLYADTLEKIEGFGISSRQVFKMFRLSCQLLRTYLDENGLEFSLENGQKWLSVIRPCDPLTKSQNVLYLTRRRAVFLLSECQDGKLDTWRTYCERRPARAKSAGYLQSILAYTEKLKNDGMANATIELAELAVNGFLIYLEGIGKFKASEITAQDVTGYFASDKFSGRKPNGVRAYADKLRSFLSFLEDMGGLPGKKLSLAVPKVFAKQESIVKVLSVKAVKAIKTGDAKSDRGAATRNHAMVLLGLRLGLRRSDIVKMKLTDIDWKNDSISFIQQKTSVPIALPLLPDVGNSLMEYILNFRPKASNDRVFLTHYAPYRAVTPRTMTDIAKSYLSVFDSEDCPQYSPHILRRTLATGMLRNNIPRSFISAAIGQVDPDSVDVYLSADEENMRGCALPLTGIECEREDLT